MFATTFFVSQKTRHPCCGARLFRRSQRSLEKFDRGHSLASLFPPPAAVGSLPRSVAPPLRRKDRSRRLGAFALRAAFSFSFLRCSLRSRKIKGKDILSDGALCAPTLIPHSPLPFPRSAPTQRTSFFLRGRRFFLLVVAAPAARKRSRAFADFTCSRRRFLFLKKRAIPVAVPAFFGARSARLKNSTAATRSPPFFRHRRRSARSPVPSLLLFGEKTVPAASGLSPCGRRSLSLFSDARFARERSRARTFYRMARFARLP